MNLSYTMVVGPYYGDGLTYGLWHPYQVVAKPEGGQFKTPLSLTCRTRNGAERKAKREARERGVEFYGTFYPGDEPTMG